MVPRSMTSRTVLSIFYGIDIKTHDDPYVAISEKPVIEGAKALVSPATLVVRVSYRFSLSVVPTTADLTEIDFNSSRRTCSQA
jgi:hypothetical protein